MKPILKSSSANFSRLALVPGLMSLALAACMSEPDRAAAPAETETRPAAQVGDVHVLSVPMYTTDINFQDPAALSSAHVGLDNKVVFPYAYNQSIGPQATLRVYHSYGPKKSTIRQCDTSYWAVEWADKCHTLSGMYGHKVNGVCQSMTSTVNRWQLSYLGTEWLAAYAYNSTGANVVFDVSRIRVRGTVGIIFWYKTFQNEWKSKTFAPGYHQAITDLHLIREFHIAAASGNFDHKYSVDDIRIHYSP